MLVVDASVATKWFVIEDLHEEAKRLLDSDVPLLAPRIIEVEVASAIIARARRGEMPQAHALKLVSHWLKDFLDSPALQLVENHKLLAEAARMAAVLDHKLPDCLYLALAQDIGGFLVTADAQQARKGQRVKGLQVRLLGQA